MALTVGELVGYLSLDASQFDNTLNRIRRQFATVDGDVRRFGQSAGQLGGIAVRMAAISAAGSLAQTVLSGLAAGAISASGGLLVLPGAAAAGGAAFAALAVGTQGFADALTASDPAEFAEALAGLAPSARDTAVAVRELGPAWQTVQQSVQQELFSEMGDVVRQVGTTYLPILGTGLTSIASSFGVAAGGVARFLTEARTVQDVGGILSNTSAAVANLGTVTQPLLQVFRDLAAVGAGFLPQLTASAGALAERFAAFIAHARETGQLAGWIQGAITALSTLARIAGNVASALGAVFAAASGGGGALAVVEQLTAGFAGFLNSAQGSTALSQLFGGLEAAASGLVPALLQVAQVLLTSVAPVVAQLGPNVGQLAGLFGSALSTAVQVLAGALAPVVAGLSWLGGLMADNAGAVSYLASVLGGAAAAIGVIAAVSRAWIAVQWALNAALTANPIGIVVVAIGALVGALIWVWNNVSWFRDFWVTVWNGLLVVVQPLINFFTTQVVPRFQQAWALISAGLNRFSAWWGEIWRTHIIPAVRPVVEFFVAEVVPRLQAAWNLIMIGVQAFVDWFGFIWRSGLGDTVIGVVSAAWIAAVGIIGGALTYLQGLINFFLGVFTGDWSQAWFGARQILDGAMIAIRAAVQGGIDAVLAIVRNLPGALWAIVSTAGSWLVQTGRDMVNGLINGLRQLGAQIGEVLMGFAHDAWQRVKSFFGIASPSRLMMGAGVNIGRGLALGIASQAAAVDRAFGTLATTPALPAAVLPAPRLAAPLTPPTVAAPPAVAYRPPPPPGLEPGAAASTQFGGSRSAVHIDQFHATAQQTPGDIARELDWLSRGRG